MKNQLAFTILLLLSSLLLLSGCIDQNGNTLTPPFTASQFFSKVTDLNYTVFINGGYDGNFVIVDGNKLSVSPFPDVNGLDINTSWSNITGFPTPCGTNQAVRIIGTTLTCVTLYTDSNLPSYVMMDTNDINRLNTSIPTFDLLFSFGNKIVGDGNLYFNSLTDTLYNRRLVNTFDVNTNRICFQDGTCQTTEGLTTSDWNKTGLSLYPSDSNSRILIGGRIDNNYTQIQIDTPIVFVPDVQNPVVTQVAGNTFLADGTCWDFSFFGYKVRGVQKIESLNLVPYTFCDDGSFTTFDMDLNWDAIPGADGYWIRINSNTSYGNRNAVFNNTAIDTPINTFHLQSDSNVTTLASILPSSPFSSGFKVKGDFEIEDTEAIYPPQFVKRQIDYSGGTLNNTNGQLLVYSYFTALDGTPVVSFYGGFFDGSLGDYSGNNFQVIASWDKVDNAQGYFVCSWLGLPDYTFIKCIDAGNVTTFTVNGDYTGWNADFSGYSPSPHTRSNLLTNAILSTDQQVYLAQYLNSTNYWDFTSFAMIGFNPINFAPSDAQVFDQAFYQQIWQDPITSTLNLGGVAFLPETAVIRILQNAGNFRQVDMNADLNIFGNTNITGTTKINNPVDDGASALQVKGNEIVVDNVSSGTATQVAGTSFVANGNDWAFNITAYKLVGTQRVYSTTPYQINILDDGLGGTYDIDLSWGAVTDANGYMIFIGAVNNYPDLSGRAMDVATNSVTFNGLNTIHGPGNGTFLPQSPYTPTTKNLGDIQMVNPETLANPVITVSKDYLGGSYNNQSLAVSVFAYKNALDGTQFVSLENGESNYLPISDSTATNFEVTTNWSAVPDALGYFVDVYDFTNGVEWYVDVGNVLTYLDDGTHTGWTTGILLETYPFSPYTKAKIFSDEFWSSDNRSFLAKYDEYNQVWSFPQNMFVNNVILNATEDGGQIYAGGNNIWWSNVDNNFYLGGRPSGFFGAQPVITIPFNNMEFGEVTIDANVHVDGNLYQHGSIVCDKSGNCPDNDTNYRTWDNNTFTNALVTNDLNVDRDLNVGRNIHIVGNLSLDGNTSMKRPYIMASSTKTQTIANSTLAYTVDFNTTEDNYLMHTEVTATDTNIKVDLSGDYRFDISALAYTTSGSNKHIYIWMQKLSPAGAWVDVPRSNTQVEIPTQQVETVIAVPFIIDLNAGGKIRFKWGSDTTAAQLLYLGAGSNPTRPEVPSIIVVGNKVSEIAH